jgi:large subunit ribosomal protein L21
MIAIIEVGSKQFQVKAGDIIDVDHQDAEIGDKITLNVLMTATEDGKTVNVGTPLVEGVKLTAKVLEHYNAEKITVFKMKSKKRYSRTKGFRAHRTKIEIGKIA